MKFSNRIFAAAVVALFASPVRAEFVEIDERPARQIAWETAPAHLRKAFLDYRKANDHCWSHEEENWSVPSPMLVAHDLKGGAVALFQVCNLGGGARIVSWIVMLARGKSLENPKPAVLEYHTTGSRKVEKTSDIVNPAFDAKRGALSSNEPLDMRGEHCQRRREWRWTGSAFKLASIREWKKCDEEWPGADDGKPMPQIWPKRG